MNKSEKIIRTSVYLKGHQIFFIFFLSFLIFQFLFSSVKAQAQAQAQEDEKVDQQQQDHRQQRHHLGQRRHHGGRLELLPEHIERQQEDYERGYLESISPVSQFSLGPILQLAGFVVGNMSPESSVSLRTSLDTYAVMDGTESSLLEQERSQGISPHVENQHGEPQHEKEKKVESVPTPSIPSTSVVEPRERPDLDKTYLRYQLRADESLISEKLWKQYKDFIVSMIGEARYQELLITKNQNRREAEINHPQRDSELGLSSDEKIEDSSQDSLPFFKSRQPHFMSRLAPQQKGFDHRFKSGSGLVITVDLENKIVSGEIVAEDERCQKLVDQYCANQLENLNCLKRNKNNFPPQCGHFLKDLALGIMCNGQIQRHCGHSLHDNKLAAECLESKMESFTQKCRPRGEEILKQIRGVLK